MTVRLLTEPFTHILNDSFFNEIEYHDVWQEIKYLSHRMRPPKETGAAQERGISAKKGVGIFLSHFFVDPHDSSIFRATRKIFNTRIYEQAILESEHQFRGFFNKINYDEVLLQMYANGDYYKSHTDENLFTHITQINKTPKQFTGGELYFAEFDYTVNLNNNQSIIFPSYLLHEVKQVKTISENFEDFRFTISNFLSQSKLPNG